MEPIFVGIDVSKARLDVHVLPQGEAFSVTRDAAGLDALAERLLPLSPRLVVLEATGGFESVAAASLAAAGFPVAVVNPARVRSFAQAMARHAKTDAIDAAVIARFAVAVEPDARALPDEETRIFADLVARRRQIIAMIVAERQREKRASRRMRKSIQRLLAALQLELSDIDTEIDDTVRGSPIWREKVELLVSVPGVGNKTARSLIAELPELGSIGRREIAALAGLAPFTRQSGQWRGRSHIAGGRTVVRTALFPAAMAAARHNPDLKAFHSRLIEAGKPKMLALIAVARKLLTILNAIIRDKKPWQSA